MGNIRVEKKDINIIETKFGNIETIDIHGNTWYILPSVCKLLCTSTSSVSNIAENKVKIRITDGNNVPTTIVNRYDLLRICEERIRIMNERPYSYRNKQCIPIAEYLIFKLNLRNTNKYNIEYEDTQENDFSNNDIKDLQIFDNKEFGQIRTIYIENKIYFVAKDVATALGYAKPRNAINQHCKGALKWGVLTKGGKQEMSIIPEGDVYRLVTSSKLPNAQKFEEWVYDEILPSIRQNGFYNTNQSTNMDQTLENAILNPDFLIKLAEKIKTEQERRKEIEERFKQERMNRSNMITSTTLVENLHIENLTSTMFNEWLALKDLGTYEKGENGRRTFEPNNRFYTYLVLKGHAYIKRCNGNNKKFDITYSPSMIDKIRNEYYNDLNNYVKSKSKKFN